MPFPINNASRYSIGRTMKGYLRLGIKCHGLWSRQASGRLIKVNIQGIALGHLKVVVHSKWSFKRSGRLGKFDCIFLP